MKNSEEEDDSDDDELDSVKEKLERELDGYEGGVSDDDGEDLGTDGVPKGGAFLQYLRQKFQEIF